MADRNQTKRQRADRALTGDTLAPENMDTPTTTKGDRKQLHAKLKSALITAGLNSKGINTLGNEDLLAFANQLDGSWSLNDPTNTMAFKARVFNAVSETNLERLPELITKLGQRGFSLTVMREVLSLFSHPDPFEAASRMQPTPISAKIGRRGAKSSRPVATSASGHQLYRDFYAVYDSKSPEQRAQNLGQQAYMSFMKMWKPEGVLEKARSESTDRRNKDLRNATRELLNLEGITFPELLEAGNQGQLSRYPLLTRNLDVFHDLQQAIRDCSKQLEALIYTGAVVNPAIDSLNMALDSGGQTRRWFEEHLSSNESAPEGVALAAQAYFDPNIALTAEEQSFIARGLLAYKSSHSYVTTKVALAGLASDLAEYDSLPKDHRLSGDPGIAKAGNKLRQLLQDGTKNNLTIQDFAEALQSTPIIKFRREMNREVLERYREEFEAALTEQFAFVLFEGGQLREDASKASVPMERLEKHLYGAKVGIRRADQTSEERSALLSQKDFSCIRDAQRLRFAVTDEHKFLAAYSIKEFREIIEGVVIASRKAKFLEASLANYAKTPAGTASVAQLNKENVGDTLEAWLPVLPVGGTFTLVEKWYDNAPDRKPVLGSPEEIAKRFLDRKESLIPKHKLGKSYATHQQEVEAFVRSGLYDTKLESFWRKLEGYVRDLVALETYRAAIDNAATVVAHPMYAGEDMTGLLTRKFLAPDEIKRIEDLAAIKPQLGEIFKGYSRGQLADLLSEFVKLRGGASECRIIKADPVRHVWTLSSQPFATLIEKISSPQNPSQMLPLFDPKSLREQLDLVGTEYLKVIDQDEEWKGRAKQVFGPSASELTQGSLIKKGVNYLVDKLGPSKKKK